MPISQSVRPTATVQVMCTEGTLARESKPDEVEEEEIAATSRRRRNRHEQTQLQQHRQPLTACLSLCQCVTLSVSSSSPQPTTARGGSVLPLRPRTTRGLCQGSGRRTTPVCTLLQLLHTCTPGPARRALVHSPSPTVMVPRRPPRPRGADALSARLSAADAATSARRPCRRASVRSSSPTVR
jgi:hypothetical protein